MTTMGQRRLRVVREITTAFSPFLKVFAETTLPVVITQKVSNVNAILNKDEVNRPGNLRLNLRGPIFRKTMSNKKV